MERRLTAILAADVVGYSRLMSSDEAGTIAALRSLRKELADPAITAHKGRIFKLTGDGMLVEFPSVVSAVACAVDIQSAMRTRNASTSEARIEFRIGVNLGDIIVEEGDIFGDGVNVAARLESIAPVGGIAVSQSVRDHVGKRLDLAFEDMGERRLKNIDAPVRVYSITLDQPPKDGTSSARQQGERPSVAVLPFINMSGDPEQEYFSDGITEDIITDLSKVSGLFVVARNTVFTYKGKTVEVQQVAKHLGVNFILEGSVRKAGTRVRVTGQLIHGKDGGHVWADRYDRDLTDIFAIQDEITHAIVEQLKVKLLPQEKKSIGQTPTDNVEAYTYYLRGRQFMQRHSKSNYQLARRMFAKAVELDPLYARAYAGIADCDSFLFLHYHLEAGIDSILATSAKALALDDRLAEAHASRGLALSLGQRHEEAIAEFEEAIALDPNSFEAHYFYARACVTQGKLERAATLFERAAENKPDDYQALCLLIHIYRSLGRDRDSKSTARKAIERAESELTLHPENPRAAYLGANALATLGEKDRAREWAARALAIDPDDVLIQYNVACVYSLLGDLEQAFDLLEGLLPNAGYELKRGWIKHDSDLDPLRSHPRFQKTLEVIERG
ncbi:MAG: adenylate/guanylate cyclase domain-containing protein [Verrucomicrobia bacterium]|nr:MAG: adenylate/guanylate cyclase domain-containing protein [Verrucomicrobiota bacterium]PYM08293.1 MAG: adenylate/guanylate cyclase domain-containing protein [Verrucomicrobiota bacterium]